MRASDVRVGQRISFVAPRVPTPNASPVEGIVPPGGEVHNRSSQRITTTVRSIERSETGEYIIKTDAKVTHRVPADGHVVAWWPG